MKVAVVFDVNETLLDLSGLDPFFERTFGDTAARREWFAQLLHTAMVTTVTGRYETFGQLGAACLRAMGEHHGCAVDPEELSDALMHLAPHPEVAAALRLLNDAGFRLGALTQSTLHVVWAQLENAGVVAEFEQILSADEVRRLKPAPEPYRHAAQRLGVGVADMVMVAAHGWDVAGAQAAGARGAFVARAGHYPLPAAPIPDLVGADLESVARALANG